MQADAHPEGIIHLDVAATDREGKPFSGLAGKDFTLADNGVPQESFPSQGRTNPLRKSMRLSLRRAAHGSGLAVRSRKSGYAPVGMTRGE